jgi:hypothetical protein
MVSAHKPQHGIKAVLFHQRLAPPSRSKNLPDRSIDEQADPSRSKENQTENPTRSNSQL